MDIAGREPDKILRELICSAATVVFLAVAAGVVFGACGKASRNPTQPTRNTVPVTGTWTGSYQVSSCRGGMQACFGLKESYPIRLVLDQSLDRVTGAFSGDVPGASNASSVPLEGSVDSSGILRVQGEQPYQSLPYAAGIEVRDWATSVSSEGRTMTGRFHMTIRFRTNNAYPDIWNIDATLMSLTR